MVPIMELREFPNNPRRGDVELLVESLGYHGQYRPIVAKFGKYYDIEPYKTTDKRKYEGAVCELTLDHVLNTLLFFSTLELELYNDSLVYLAKEITEIVKEMKEQQPLTA